MIPFLFKNFRKFPVIGDPIKAMYVGHLINEVATKGKDSPAVEKLKKLGGDELEKEIKSESGKMFDEHVKPEIAEFGIPNFIIDKAKKDAIKKFSAMLRKEIEKAVDEAIKES